MSTPIGGIDFSDDPILPPWYIPGWTAQDVNSPQFSIAAPANPIDAFGTLPSSLDYVTVQGTFGDGNNNQLGGYLTFEQSADLLIQDPPGTYFRVPSRLVGDIPVANLLAWNAEGSGKVYLQFGKLQVILLATDQPNATIEIMEPYYKTQEPGFVQPTSWVYHVKEYFERGYKYDIAVPSTLVGVTPLPDINSLIIPNTLELNHDWHRGY